LFKAIQETEKLKRIENYQKMELIT
jgi:hypothetical protein